MGKRRVAGRATITAVLQTLQCGFKDINHRFDSMESNFDAKLDRIDKRVNRSNRKIGKVNTYFEKRINILADAVDSFFQLHMRFEQEISTERRERVLLEERINLIENKLSSI